MQQTQVRVLDHHAIQHTALPSLKPSSNSGLPLAWITEPATDSSQWKPNKTALIRYIYLYNGQALIRGSKKLDC